MTTSVRPDSSAYSPPSSPSIAQSRGRIASVDILRGLVMIVMAIDHVRVYAGVPSASADPAVFFTRWITHFVAPAFCFFAGTGAFFHGRKLGDLAILRRYLISRGLVLVALELTLIRFCWTFNLDFAHYNLAGVIWMLGWSMVALAGLTKFSTKTIGIIGLVIIFAQQVIGVPYHFAPDSVKGMIGWLWNPLYMGAR